MPTSKQGESGLPLLISLAACLTSADLREGVKKKRKRAAAFLQRRVETVQLFIYFLPRHPERHRNSSRSLPPTPNNLVKNIYISQVKNTTGKWPNTERSEMPQKASLGFKMLQHWLKRWV